MQILTIRMRISYPLVSYTDLKSKEHEIFFYNEIKSIVNYKRIMIIVGNFTNPSVDWSTLTVDQEGFRLINLIEDTFLNQLANTSARGSNIIHLFLTTDSDLLDSCEVSEAPENSDHNIIRLEINKHFKVYGNKPLIQDYR